mmetsp:Transcript_21130/g.62937  ORF Transcript_21130/g.62937 Transcript_21130/m.62937 type:complete len:421 (+) Transcript_21130:270-1532(+)
MSSRAAKRPRMDLNPAAHAGENGPLLATFRTTVLNGRASNLPSSAGQPVRLGTAGPAVLRSRPRGRPPKGMVWNQETGQYEPAPPTTGPDGTILKAKARVDPNKPKRAMSSFLYYAKTVRPALIKGGLTFVEAQKKMAADWKKMSKETRQPFEDIAEGERQRYKRQMLTYVPPPVSNMKQGAGLSKPASAGSRKAQGTTVPRCLPAAPTVAQLHKGKPKRPPSSFLLYCQENRERVKHEVAPTSGAPMQLVQRRLADEWKALPQSSKKYYLDKQTRLAADFKRDKEVWDGGTTADTIPSRAKAKNGGKARASSRDEAAFQSHPVVGCAGPASKDSQSTVATATDALAYADQLATYHDLLALQYYQTLQQIQSQPNPHEVSADLQEKVMLEYGQLVEVTKMLNALPHSKQDHDDELSLASF